MRRIDALPFGVHGCSLLPYVGNATAGGEWFVDTGVEAVNPRFIVSRAGCEELAKFAGFVAPAELQAALDDNALLAERIVHLEAELEDERKVNEAIDVIESRDFRARKRPGRKPMKKSEQVEEVVA